MTFFSTLVSKYSLKLDNRQKILETSLTLFATFGFEGISTARIAQQADVSEALIFKHYKNKRGLLQHIMMEMEQRIAEIFSALLQEKNPETVILSFINTPYQIPERDYNYWRLSFKLKWDQRFYSPYKLKPIINKVAWAFRQLGKPNAKIEAELLFHNIESIVIKILREGRSGQLKYKKHLIKKSLDVNS